MQKQMAGAAALFFLIALQAKAQKGIEKLIATEKSFAAAALTTNTRDAFMAFMDTAEAVVFNNGQVVGAFTQWNNTVADTAKLIWQPAYAGLAQSGELGFTTGQWQFKQNLAGSAVAAGCFATIWHLNKRGTWKFLLDIGTNGQTALPCALDSVKTWVGTTIDDLDTKDALTIDRLFIQQYAAIKNDAFKAVLTNDSWFNLPGQAPLAGVRNIETFLPQIPVGLDFNPLGGGVSASSDFAYVYGTVRHEATIANYLRVWQKRGDKYMLLVQTLQW